MINIVDLYKRFHTQHVLNGLNLEVRKGETLVILGPSGVGKSVLLKHIIGLTKPDAGYVEVDGENITSLRGPKLLKATKRMGMLFQGAALFDSMTIEENVGFYLSEHADPISGKRMSRSEKADRVNEALKMVGLLDTHKKIPSELSGGMKKRAGLARLIAYRPVVLLYDEPTTGLDPITAMQINELIVQTQEELKATSVVVTHDIPSAIRVSDRLALIRNGQIAHVGTIDTFNNIDDPIIETLRSHLK